MAKKWATSYFRICSALFKHPSKAAAYCSARSAAVLWSRGALRSRYLMVWVDELDGQGWQRYEELDLAELIQADQARD